MKKSLLLLVTLLASLSAWAGEVTVNIVGNGTVDVTYNGSTTEQNISSGWEMYLSGSLTLTMTPAQGYTLQELQVVTNVGSGTESTTENNGVYSYTIRNVGFYTITYTVVFSQSGVTTYTLTGPDGMVFSVGGETVTSAEEGQRVDITLPAPGNHSYWVVTSSDAAIQNDDANHFHFTMPAKSVIVTAQQYTQTAHYVIDESTHGHVMVNGNEPGTEGHYADETITLTPMPDEGYEYMSGSLTATNNLSNEAIDLTGNGDGTWSFTMPNAQVTVSATFKKAPVITSYVDADGVVHDNVQAIPLDETMTSLGEDEQESWYVASGTLNYTQTLTFAGDFHLILADGAVMNIGTEAEPVTGKGIDGSEYYSDFTIYGQTLDDDTAGHLNINTDKECIEVAGDYAQHSGNVTANSVNENGVVTWYNFAFTGGTLYITAKANAIDTNDKVDILGGKLSAVCVGNYFGINSARGVATIGWKNADDEFTVSNFAVTVKIVDGQAFTDGENIYDSTTPTEIFRDLTNVTLRPVATFAISLPESFEHGTVSCDKQTAYEGQTVTLTVKPDNGYELETLTVTFTNENEPSGSPLRLQGGSLELTPGENGIYTFAMPAQPVTVNATFKETTITGVEDINAAQPKSGQRFNVMGQPVGKDYKGIVIEDGKKLIVR